MRCSESRRRCSSSDWRSRDWAYWATLSRSAAVVAVGRVLVLRGEQLGQLAPARQVAVVLVGLGVRAVADVDPGPEERDELPLGEVVHDLVEVLGGEAPCPSSRRPPHPRAPPRRPQRVGAPADGCEIAASRPDPDREPAAVVVHEHDALEDLEDRAVAALAQRPLGARARRRGRSRRSSGSGRARESACAPRVGTAAARARWQGRMPATHPQRRLRRSPVWRDVNTPPLTSARPIVPGPSGVVVIASMATVPRDGVDRRADGHLDRPRSCASRPTPSRAPATSPAPRARARRAGVIVTVLPDVGPADRRRQRPQFGSVPLPTVGVKPGSRPSAGMTEICGPDG